MQTDKYEYVGFWARVGATLIDTILMALVLFPLLTAIYGSGYWESPEPVQGPADFLLSWVLPAVVVIVFWVARQATPGKMLIKARIVDAETGESIGPGKAIGRYFAYLVSTLPICLGYLWVAFDKRKQGWHDKLAGTVVVRRPWE